VESVLHLPNRQAKWSFLGKFLRKFDYTDWIISTERLHFSKFQAGKLFSFALCIIAHYICYFFLSPQKFGHIMLHHPLKRQEKEIQVSHSTAWPVYQEMSMKYMFKWWTESYTLLLKKNSKKSNLIFYSWELNRTSQTVCCPEKNHHDFWFLYLVV